MAPHHAIGLLARQNNHCPAGTLCPVVPNQEWGEMDGIGTVRGAFGRIGPDGNRSWGIGARTHVGETRYTMGRAGWRWGRTLRA